MTMYEMIGKLTRACCDYREAALALKETADDIYARLERRYKEYNNVEYIDTMCTKFRFKGKVYEGGDIYSGEEFMFSVTNFTTGLREMNDPAVKEIEELISYIRFCWAIYDLIYEDLDSDVSNSKFRVEDVSFIPNCVENYILIKLNDWWNYEEHKKKNNGR